MKDEDETEIKGVTVGAISKDYGEWTIKQKKMLTMIYVKHKQKGWGQH
jgi:hypothetical protein